MIYIIYIQINYANIRTQCAKRQHCKITTATESMNRLSKIYDVIWPTNVWIENLNVYLSQCYELK